MNVLEFIILMRWIFAFITFTIIYTLTEIYFHELGHIFCYWLFSDKNVNIVIAKIKRTSEIPLIKRSFKVGYICFYNVNDKLFLKNTVSGIAIIEDNFSSIFSKKNWKLNIKTTAVMGLVLSTLYGLLLSVFLYKIFNSTEGLKTYENLYNIDVFHIALSAYVILSGVLILNHNIIHPIYREINTRGNRINGKYPKFTDLRIFINPLSYKEFIESQYMLNDDYNEKY